MNEQIRQTHLTPDEVEAAAERSASLADARLRHLESCRACAAEVEESRRLSAALAALPTWMPTPGFAERVMARVSLPVPWHRRIAAAVRESTAAGLGAATTIAALLAGAGLWVTQFPELRPLALAGWLAGQAGDLLWSAVLAGGRALYVHGLTDLATAFGADLTMTSALAALATVALVGIGALSVMIRLVRHQPSRLASVR
ncbi:MAG: anti-sigma factor family protein [Gemmatimonadota bacterium]